MSWNPLLATGSPDAVGMDSIETLIVPRSVDVNPFIRRVLPAPQRQMVGPFIFFDQFGPLEVIASSAGDVRPHPHIGLATVTYIYRGEVHHRDSLGTSQIIAPGAVNWMVAGRGITHSERAPAELLGHSVAIYGIQTWVALPEREEDAAPRFEHHPREALPVLEDEGINLRLILGKAYGAVAPASVFSDTFYADVALQPGARMPLPDDHEDRGLHILEGSISVAGETFQAGQMMIFRPKELDKRRRRAVRRPPCHPRRRDTRRPALHLVEFRVVQPAKDRGRQGGMAQGRLGARAVRPAPR